MERRLPRHTPTVAEKVRDREQSEYSKRLDAFFAEGEEMRKIQLAYNRACQLDDLGQHEDADRVLAEAGEDAERIRLRRRHLNWKAANA